MEILDGKKVSQEKRQYYKEKIKDLESRPSLIVLTVNPGEASSIYINQKEKACGELGIDFKKQVFLETVSQDEIIDIIHKLNLDDSIDGILLQLPIPSHLNARDIINEIAPSKDVDGLTDANAGGLMHNQDVLKPCTALGVIDLLDAYNIDLAGKNVLLVGRSDLVGKPLIPLFLNRDSTVTIAHSKSDNLKKLALLADIIVVATGKPGLITDDMVKQGAVVVDVGINRIDGKIVGDVDFDTVKDKTSYITPVPGGVGPMTIVSLIRNVYFAHLNRKK